MNRFAAAFGRLFRRPPMTPRAELPAAMAPRAELRTRVRNSAYEAAGQGRRWQGWPAPTVGPNDLTLGTLSVLRDRSRAAVRNDGYARAAIDRAVSNIVGTGIVPQSQAPDPAFRDSVHRLWNVWCDQADSSSCRDFYGLMSLAVRSWLESGEVFVRIRPRLLTDRLPVPLQLQLVEPESCPSTYQTITATGNVVRAGIEFDAIGRRVAYHFYAQRPGDIFGLQRGLLSRVPAVNINGHLLVAHLYEPLRPGQIRGIPQLTQALQRLKELSDYDDATLLRVKLANMYAGFIKRPATLTDGHGTQVDPLTGKPIDLDADGRPVLALEPGMFGELNPGEDVTFNDPPDAGATYAEFIRGQLMGASVAAGVPYELLTHDLRNVSDRVLRVILNEFRRGIEAWQHQTVAFLFCKPVWDSWFTQALMSGALPIPKGYEQHPEVWRRVEWTPPAWPYIHPVQDIEATRAAIRAGLKSRTQAIRELGFDVEALDREIAADNERADRLGLTFDSDPRKTGPSQTLAVPPDATPTTPSGASGQVIKRVIRDENGLITVVVEDHFPSAGVRVPKVRVQNYVEVPKRTRRLERDANGRVIRIVEENE